MVSVQSPNIINLSTRWREGSAACCGPVANLTVGGARGKEGLRLSVCTAGLNAEVKRKTLLCRMPNPSQF
jgi:hypothetical protein